MSPRNCHFRATVPPPTPWLSIWSEVVIKIRGMKLTEGATPRRGSQYREGVLGLSVVGENWKISDSCGYKTYISHLHPWGVNLLSFRGSWSFSIWPRHTTLVMYMYACTLCLHPFMYATKFHTTPTFGDTKPPEKSRKIKKQVRNSAGKLRYRPTFIFHLSLITRSLKVRIAFWPRRKGG